MNLNGAGAGAVFLLRPTGPWLCASVGIDNRTIESVERVWARQGDELRARHVVHDGGRAIVPLHVESSLVGFLCLDRLDDHVCGPSVRAAVCSSLARTAKRALQRDDEVPDVKDVVSHDEREKLVGDLDRHEWNIARVARLYGVTRPTIYARLEKFGIERRRVPKTR